MDNFDLRKYLAESRLLKENEPNFEDIEIGDKFVERVDDMEVFTVVTVDVESITLKDSDGIQTTYPDDFNDGDFFDWFKPLKTNKMDNFDLKKYLAESRVNKATIKEEIKLIDKVDMDSLEIGDVDTADWPKFTDAYIEAATFQDGTPLTDQELDQLTDELYQDGRMSDLAYQSLLEGKTEREQKLIKEVLKTIKTNITELSEKEKIANGMASDGLVKSGEPMTTLYTNHYKISFDYDGMNVNIAFRPDLKSAEKTKSNLESTGVFDDYELKIEKLKREPSKYKHLRYLPNKDY